MAKFIKLHECGKEAYVNIDQITFVHEHTYKIVDGGNKTVTQVVVAHGYLEVDESEQEVMNLIRMADRRHLNERL